MDSRSLDLMAQLDANAAAAQILRDKLNGSLALAVLWPAIWARRDAVPGGRVCGRWYQFYDVLTYRITLRDANGADLESRTFDRPAVPPCLDTPESTESAREHAAKSPRRLRAFDARTI